MRISTRVLTALGAALLAAMPVWASAQGTPRVSFASPAANSTVTGPKVDVRLRFENFKTVDGGTAVKAGEGHAHLYVDRGPMRAGELIPTDQANIVHLGAAPYDSRSVDLQPGRHTLRVQLGDSGHKALDVPVATVSFTVSAAGGAPPARPSDTGDGSLADTPGPGAWAFIVVLLIAGTVLVLGVRRRRA